MTGGAGVWESGDIQVTILFVSCTGNVEKKGQQKPSFCTFVFWFPFFSRLGRLRSGGAKGPGLFFILPCIDRWTSHLTIIPSPQATVYWWEQPLRWPISANMQRAAQGKNKEKKMPPSWQQKCHDPGGNITLSYSQMERRSPARLKSPTTLYWHRFVSSYKKVDLRTVSFDVPPQEVGD